MKKLLIALLILVPFVCRADTGVKAEDYTITVHVQSSRLSKGTQRVKALVDGKKLTLEAAPPSIVSVFVFRVGDYKARIVKDDTPRPYDYMRTYEFLLPDGKTRKFWVVGESE